MKWLAVWLMGVIVAGCGAGDGSSRGDAVAAHPGEQTYIRFCFSCHAAGIAGAPRTGDPDAWARRLERGEEALLQTTIDGIPPGMPARGLCRQCTDEELADAIDFMLPRQI
jgi:cytochrome c5